MNTPPLKPLLILIARLVVAGTFVLAAFPKIQDPIAFAASVRGFQVLDAGWAPWIALILPWFELVIGIGLLVPTIRRVSGCAMALLLALFIGLHASAWARGLDVACGCFGTATEPSTDYRLLILRNTALLLATVWVVQRDFRTFR